MKTLSMACLLALLLAVPAIADDTEKAADQPAAKSAEDTVKQNPNDVKTLNDYMNKAFGSLRGMVNKDPDAAEAKLDELTKFLESLEPSEQAAKTLVQRAKSAVTFYRKQAALARVTMAELIAKLEADAGDVGSLSSYVSKMTQQISGLTRSAPEEAEKQLKAAREFLANVAEKTENEAVKKRIASLERTFSSLEQRIESGKKLAAMIGKDAAPLTVEAWVNGSPLTESDLKGKVVLLDFWAVWCGPCIATFPHLREWREEYSDKGLVIVGLTKFYNYAWDDEAGRAKRSKEKVSADDELAMLEKFAESYDLHHRFAIQKGRELSKYYGVSGIPHVVVIDREQKIRLMRVGSGEANAQAVGAMIKELIGE